jgi:hypothetical protein
MFIFALGLKMWAYSVSDSCGSIFKVLIMVITNQSQQCQYAEYGYPIGIIFMILGGIVGIGGVSMRDETPDELID